MKNNNTTTKSTNSSTSRARFNYLKTLFHQAPLSKSELNELKTLAKKLDPKMAKWMDENPELC
jgi:hypothetical protein